MSAARHVYGVAAALGMLALAGACAAAETMRGQRASVAPTAQRVAANPTAATPPGVPDPAGAFSLPPGLALRWPAGSFALVQEDGHETARLSLPGAGQFALVANAAPLAPPLDLRGRFVRIEIRVDDVKRLGGMGLRLSSDGLRESWFEFTVPIFKDERFNLLQDDDWVPLTWTFGAARSVGTPDRGAIDSVGWVVQDRAPADGGGPVVVEWRDFRSIAEPAEGVVSLTFDDGYDEHFTVAAPLLAEHGFRGTAYVMPDQLGWFGYLTAEQARALHERYGWDLSAHHARAFTTFEPDALDRELAHVRSVIEELGDREGARHLAYPEGRQDPVVVLPLARKYFATARIASGGPETLPPADPHRLRVMNVLSTTTPEEIASAARRAHEHHEWLILMFHWLVDAPARDTEYAISDLRRALDLLASEHVPVRTVSEVWRGLEAQRQGDGLPAAPRE